MPVGVLKMLVSKYFLSSNFGRQSEDQFQQAGPFPCNFGRFESVRTLKSSMAISSAVPIRTESPSG